MAHSYLLGGALAGLHVRIAAPPGFQPDPARGRSRRRRWPPRSGGSVSVTDVGRRRGRRAPTWSPPTPGSRWGRRDDGLDRETIFAPYAADSAELLARAAPRRDRAALPARLPGQGDRRRGARRPAVGGLGRGGEPAARAEGDARSSSTTADRRSRSTGRRRRVSDHSAARAPLTKTARQAKIIALLEHARGPLADRAGRAAGRRRACRSPRARCRATWSRSARCGSADPAGHLVYAVPGRRRRPDPACRRVRHLRGPAGPAVRRGAGLGRGVGQPGRAADPAGCGAVLRLGDRPGRLGRDPRHHRRRRHRLVDHPGTRLAAPAIAERFLTMSRTGKPARPKKEQTEL